MVIRTKSGTAYCIKPGTDVIFLMFGVGDYGLGFVTDEGSYITLPHTDIDRIYKQ